MNREQYFIDAIKYGNYKRRSWIISAFALIQEGPDDWKKEPYFYRLVYTPGGVMYVNPNNTEELLPIEDAVPNQPLLKKEDHLHLKAGTLENLHKDVTTSYGNVLANCILLIFPFGKKVPFKEGKLKPGDMESLILKRFRSNPADPADRTDQFIYVDEHLKYTSATSFLENLASLWVPAGTRKSLLPPPGVNALKEKLLEEHKDRLDDPQVIALIMSELLAFDRKWLEGDDSLNFMLSKKSFDVVRARKFLMHGAEAGLSEGVKVDLVTSTLYEGSRIEDYPILNTAMRAGSFNRGAQTMLGGELVKWLLRASSNINIIKGDCGSKLGNRLVFDRDKAKKYMGFSIQTHSGPVTITEDIVEQYTDKYVAVRSPLFCKAAHTDICEICAGPRLSANPTAASSAIANYGSVMMLIYMKAMHGKSLTVAQYNYETALT